MTEQTRRGRTRVTRRYRTDVGPSWWAALVVVTVLLGLLGRAGGGFWSPFLWSVVGFVVADLTDGARASGGRTQ
jgi:hypothetical protein